jgi:sugar transferase (PEP-CTERM system associated)
MLVLLVFEFLLISLCFVAALYIRFGADAAKAVEGTNAWLKVLLSIVVVQSSFYLFDLYDYRRIRERAILYLGILQAFGLACIVLSIIFYAAPQLMLGRGVFLLSLALMLITMTCWRLLVSRLLGLPSLRERVLIVGTGENAIELAREALDRREHGYDVVGFVGDDPKLVGQSLINPRVIGLVSDIEELVQRHKPGRLVVAMGDRRGRLPLESLLNIKLRDSIAIEESSSFYERLTGKIRIQMLRPSWLIFSTNSQGMRIYKQVRRIADVLLSIVGLSLSFPVMALTALAIKLDSRGPILYIQERVGLQNRIFRIIKFRSMITDAEQNGPVWAEEADPRITRVGRVIRKLRIDELPQFINVIRGDMSFIGPRPERLVFVDQLDKELPYYSQRHLVKPGLTGWAQIRYPYGATVEDAAEKLQYDLYYIKNQSPILDAIVIFETIRIVLFGRGAR